MLKETGYKEKIEMLAPWFEEIIDDIKKDLKNEHLKIDRPFCKKYFLGKGPAHITVPEMKEAYQADISSGNVGLGEFIATRWLLKNTDVYSLFEEKLSGITGDFEQLEELPQEVSVALMRTSTKQFGAKKTYLFAVFNSVVFPPSVYAELKEMAEKETHLVREEQKVQRSAESLEALQQKHEREIAALTDRYEKKLGGLQKKYLQDMEALKKQISTLHKKLNTCG